MATDVHSVVIETLEAPLPVGTRVSSVVIETLEAPLPVGTRVSSVVIETLEAPLPVGTRVSSVVIEMLEDYRVLPSGGSGGGFAGAGLYSTFSGGAFIPLFTGSDPSEDLG